MRVPWFKSGDFDAICDVCGFKRKASQIIARWDGLMVCAPVIKQGCWEIRHPQDFIRPIPDQQALPWTRPEGLDQFIQKCPEYGVQGVAGCGVADCAIADLNQGGCP